MILIKILKNNSLKIKKSKRCRIYRHLFDFKDLFIMSVNVKIQLYKLYNCITFSNVVVLITKAAHLQVDCSVNVTETASNN